MVYHPPSGSRKKYKTVQKHADARHDQASICHFLYSQRSNICDTIVFDLVMFLLANVKSIFTKKAVFYEMPENRSIDIDDKLDFELVEFLLKKKNA